MSDTAGTRYVSWKLARPAVEGHEVEIVNALGIAWRAGQRDHITCPYPSHGGSKDWRLTDKGRAICTCTQPHTDSVFDVAMKVEGLDGEQAKIRCMEIIGRHDLIKRKSGEGSFQKTDTESLMRAPAEIRDDALPLAYLAHRLGIEMAAVPRPATPTVGFRALTYFDPPKGKGTGKPIKVGEYPAAVYGTIDAKNQRHAHRIYLASGGAGKADLGLNAKGEPRDPKKSAKRIGEESTAGRSVIWGDAHVAPWCILAEGIETAAAVAYAFQSEIEQREAYVAAGINAGGIEAFVPWPATTRVTVAADRDESTKISRPNPTRRGEQAARRFGLRHDRLQVAIALAGSPGSATDWLDVHVASGTDAVREGVLAAVVFMPTAEEAAEEDQRKESLDELSQIEQDYPLPEMDNFTLSYLRTEKGRVRVHQWVKGEEGALVAVPIASPFGVLGRLRYVDQADAYGLRIAVQDMGGRRREIDVDRAGFARQAASDTRAMLFGAGLRTESDGEHVATKALKAADPSNEIAVVRRPGWHDLGDGSDRFFVCPSGEIIGLPAERAMELSVAARISEVVARGGTIEGWKVAVAAAAEVTRCPHWTIGVMAGFAAPLIALLDFDTSGISLSGATTGGKTTAQRLAVSPWSRAALDKRDSLLQTARATANGVEAMAARSNGTILALDELGHVSGAEIAKMIYTLAGGVGKSRMTADAQLRQSSTWSTFVLLSSEKSLEERVRSDGGEWAGGMAVRIADVGIDGTDRAVDAAVMARIEAVDQHFGHAGPLFIRGLINAGAHRETQGLRDLVKRTAVTIAGPEANGAVTRAALSFAVLAVAGDLGKRFGLLPGHLDVYGAIRWAWGRFQSSTDACALDPETLAVGNLRAWIAERWLSSIHPTVPDDSGRGPVRDALGWFDDDAVYIPAGRLVEAAGGVLKEVEIGRTLDKQGHIAKAHEKGCFYVSYVPKIGKMKAYALARPAFGRSTEIATQFGVFQGGRA